MTTVAFDGETLAADRRGSGTYGICTVNKIRRTKDGRLLAMAGSIADGHTLMDWLAKAPKSRGERPDIEGEDEPHVLEIYRGGIRLHEDAGGAIEIGDPQFAIGSGAAYARAAMACGLNAIEAVKLASRFDPYTGPEVEAMAL